LLRSLGGSSNQDEGELNAHSSSSSSSRRKKQSGELAYQIEAFLNWKANNFVSSHANQQTLSLILRSEQGVDRVRTHDRALQQERKQVNSTSANKENKKGRTM
jgi:hypothetical protein